MTPVGGPLLAYLHDVPFEPAQRTVGRGRRLDLEFDVQTPCRGVIRSPGFGYVVLCVHTGA
ncbi:hypothetical protein BN903_5 [Halorubrum sp. AJ67]|nr:hypothetical protein BN903_5 [Halorubrum sp. AJ67]